MDRVICMPSTPVCYVYIGTTGRKEDNVMVTSVTNQQNTGNLNMINNSLFVLRVQVFYSHNLNINQKIQHI